MAARPSEFLDWVTSDDPLKVIDPPSGQKNSGWTYLEVPPMEYMNWLFNLTDKWVKYFDFVLTGGASSIPAVSNVFTTTANLTIGSPFALSVASTSGIVVGQKISGTGIAADTFVLSISGAQVNMSKAATSNQVGTTLTFSHYYATSLTVQLQLDELDDNLTVPATEIVVTGDMTSGSKTISNISPNTNNMRIGMAVAPTNGASFPANTYVTAIPGPSSVTISNAATATAAITPFAFGHTYADGSTPRDGIGKLDSQLTKITKDPTNQTAGTVIAVLAGTTGAGAVVTGISSTAALLPGMAVTGARIQSNTYVKAILSGTSVELSRIAASAGSDTLTFAHAIATGANVQAQLDELDAQVLAKKDQVVSLASTDSPYTLDATGLTGQSGVTFVCNTAGGPIQINLPLPGATPQGFKVRVQTNAHARDSGKAVTIKKPTGANINDGSVDFVIKTAFAAVDCQWSRADNSWYTSFLPRQFLAEDGNAAAPSIARQASPDTGFFFDVSGVPSVSEAGVNTQTFGQSGIANTDGDFIKWKTFGPTSILAGATTSDISVSGFALGVVGYNVTDSAPIESAAIANNLEWAAAGDSSSVRIHNPSGGTKQYRLTIFYV